MIVSYFQAGRICDYIQDRWGADKLLDMVHSFAQLKTTPEVIQQNLGMSPEEFDKQFHGLALQGRGQNGRVISTSGATSLKELAELAKDKN